MKADVSNNFLAVYINSSADTIIYVINILDFNRSDYVLPYFAPALDLL